MSEIDIEINIQREEGGETGRKTYLTGAEWT